MQYHLAPADRVCKPASDLIVEPILHLLRDIRRIVPVMLICVTGPRIDQMEFTRIETVEKGTGVFAFLRAYFRYPHTLGQVRQYFNTSSIHIKHVAHASMRRHTRNRVYLATIELRNAVPWPGPDGQILPALNHFWTDWNDRPDGRSWRVPLR